MNFESDSKQKQNFPMKKHLKKNKSIQYHNLLF